MKITGVGEAVRAVLTCCMRFGGAKLDPGLGVLAH